jgi:hypothetical protein
LHQQSQREWQLAASETRATTSYDRAAWSPSTPPQASLTPRTKESAPSAAIYSEAASWPSVARPSVMEASAAPTTAEAAASTHGPAATRQQWMWQLARGDPVRGASGLGTSRPGGGAGKSGVLARDFLKSTDSRSKFSSGVLVGTALGSSGFLCAPGGSGSAASTLRATSRERATSVLATTMMYWATS